MIRGETNNGEDTELRRLITATIEQVVPSLLANLKGVTPVVVHGDLWSGNAGKGKFGDDDEIQHVVFDPSTCHGHSEYDLGIMRMFGGFDKAFFDEYHRLCPKTEPVEEYEDRLKLYGL